VGTLRGVYNDDDDDDDDADDDDDDDNDVVEKNTSEQCAKSSLKITESDAKRKSSEAGCSEENKTLPGNPENTKRIRMNSLSSTVTNLLKSQSANSSSNSWETMSNDSSQPDDKDNYDIGNDRIYNSLVHGQIEYDSDTDSEVARELIKYCFLSKHNENELSKLLKDKIDLLP